MAPFRPRRNNRHCEYDHWRRHSSFHTRLNIRSFHHGMDNNHNSYSRPLLPRNNRVMMYSNNTKDTSDPHQNGRRRWTSIVWDALKTSGSNIGTEFAAVVTSNLVEFGVAVISAYISNFMFS
eukprot:60473_1